MTSKQHNMEQKKTRTRKSRASIPIDIREEILRKCRRRCCMCFGLRGDLTVKEGQLAHLDKNPGNSTSDNLAFFCQECHSVYDKQSNRVLGFTPDEVKFYRDRLYATLNHERFEWCLTIRVDQAEYEKAKQVVDKAHTLLLNSIRDVNRKEGPIEP